MSNESFCESPTQMLPLHSVGKADGWLVGRQGERDRAIDAGVARYTLPDGGKNDITAFQYIVRGKP